MGIRKKGLLTQNFKIRLNVESLAEYIAEIMEKTIASDKYLGNVEIDDYYFEDNELVITGSYKTNYEYWHCDATLESPAEDEVVREYIGKHPWILNDLPEEIKAHLSVEEVEETDDMIKDDDYE